jgi:hypothetical protein
MLFFFDLGTSFADLTSETEPLSCFEGRPEFGHLDQEEKGKVKDGEASWTSRLMSK